MSITPFNYDELKTRSDIDVKQLRAFSSDDFSIVTLVFGPIDGPNQFEFNLITEFIFS